MRPEEQFVIYAQEVLHDLRAEELFTLETISSGIWLTLSLANEKTWAVRCDGRRTIVWTEQRVERFEGVVTQDELRRFVLQCFDSVDPLIRLAIL